MAQTPNVRPPINEEPEHEAPAKNSGFALLLNEAQAVQNILRDALNRQSQLLSGLKHYRRTAKNVQSTLSALQQLQQVA